MPIRALARSFIYTGPLYSMLPLAMDISAATLKLMENTKRDFKYYSPPHCLAADPNALDMQLDTSEKVHQNEQSGPSCPNNNVGRVLHFLGHNNKMYSRREVTTAVIRDYSLSYSCKVK